MFDVVDRPGVITKAEMRTHFEKTISSEPAFKATTPLGIISVNGQFSHYADPETDTMWLGFTLGMRIMQAKMLASASSVSADSKAHQSQGVPAA